MNFDIINGKVTCGSPAEVIEFWLEAKRQGYEPLRAYDVMVQPNGRPLYVALKDIEQ